MSHRWQIGGSLSGEEQLATIHRHNTFVKIPAHRGKAKAIPWTTKPEENSIKKGRRSSFTLPTLLLPQVSAVLHGGGPPGPAVSPVRNERASWTSSFSSILDDSWEAH